MTECHIFGNYIYLSSYRCQEEYYEKYGNTKKLTDEFDNFVNTLEENDFINKISLFSLSLDENNVKKIKKFIMKNSLFKTIELSFVKFYDFSLEKLMKYISKSNNMTTIKIDNIKINHYNDREQVNKIIIDNLKTRNNIKTLNFSNKIVDTDMNNFMLLLSNNKFLKKLDISDNKLGNHSMEPLGKYIEKNSELKYLDISDNKFGNQGLINFSNGLANNSSLVKLTIGNEENDIGNGIKFFYTTMSNNKYIKFFCLHKTKIDDTLIDNFVNMIILNDIIETLFLFGIKISDDNLIKVFDAIEKNTTINSLIMTNMIKNFPKNFSNTTITHLSLDIEMDNIDTIVDYMIYNSNLKHLILFNAGNKINLNYLHKTLEQNNNLEYLSLENFGEDNLVGMIDVFKINKSLINFDYICENEIDNDILFEVINSLESNNTLEKICLSKIDKLFAVKTFEKILETNYALEYIGDCMDKLRHLLTPEAKATRTKFLRTKKSVG